MKTNIKTTKLAIFKKAFIISLVILMVFAMPINYFSNKVFARDYAAEIAAKEAEISAYQTEAARLASQADTLAVALASITNEKNQLQAQIDVSQSKYDQLVAQIADTEQKIIDTKDALGETIADLYVDNNITPIEMIFGSKNISDYMDKQEYRSSVRNELTAAISQIKELKASLETQKVDAENVLNDQKNQRSVLAQKEAEQQSIIAQTNGQEQAYQQLTQQSIAAKNQIKLEQAAENAAIGGSVVAGDPNHGGYPANWDNADQDTLVDLWGMYNRECVSYVAWKVHQAYLSGGSSRDMPYWGGIGNAWEWAYDGWASRGWGIDGAEYGAQIYYDNGNWHTANSDVYGIPSGSEPKVGSVGVKNGKYGHVVWVEAVMGDNILVSQYNYNLNGRYSEMTVSKSAFQRYLYF